MTGSIVFLSGLRHHGSLVVGLSRGRAELLFLPLSALERRPRIGLAWAPSGTWLRAARARQKPSGEDGVAKAWHPFSLGLKLIVGTKAE